MPRAVKHPQKRDSGTDENLLFGIIALQMDFIDRDQLIAAMNTWVLEKSKPLGKILCDQKAISQEVYSLLGGLVRKHLEIHRMTPPKASHHLARSVQSDMGYRRLATLTLKRAWDARQPTKLKRIRTRR